MGLDQWLASAGLPAGTAWTDLNPTEQATALMAGVRPPVPSGALSTTPGANDMPGSPGYVAAHPGYMGPTIAGPDPNNPNASPAWTAGKGANYGGGWDAAQTSPGASALQQAFALGLTGRAAVDWVNANTPFKGQIAYDPAKGTYGAPNWYIAPNGANGPLDLIQRSGGGGGGLPGGRGFGSLLDPFTGTYNPTPAPTFTKGPAFNVPPPQAVPFTFGPGQTGLPYAPNLQALAGGK